MLNTMFNSIIVKPKNCEYEGKDDDEQILYVFRRAFITNFIWIVIASCLIVFPQVIIAVFALTGEKISTFIPISFLVTANLFRYLIVFGFVFQSFMNWYFNVYIITSKKIVDVDFIGVLYKNISEAAITDIEDVTSTVSGALSVIFNIGNVFVQTAGQQREFEFEFLSNPSKVRDIVSDLVADKKSGKHVHMEDD